MEPLIATKIRVLEGVNDDPRMADRARRLIAAIDCDDVATVDEAGLNDLAVEMIATPRSRHGMSGDIEPTVILNLARLGETDEDRALRKERYPELFKLGGSFPVSGAGAFGWRATGTPEHREKSGWVCQPAWQIHSIWGCHYRCAYCSLGHYINIMMNLEEFVGTLDDEIATRAPDQTLFQYDNGTDVAAFEPEYGGSELMIDYFAAQPDRFLELYVGKSANVDYLLDLDHRGHTVCCWSLAGETQCDHFERVAASMHDRIEASRKCQEAGYHVRHRFSPFIPVANWREECTEMIEALFAAVKPDVITFESIRYLGYEATMRDFAPDLLDPEYVAAMERVADVEVQAGEEVPMDYRRMMYRYIIDELERVSPETPYAFCREALSSWEHFADDFTRHGQEPDCYACNCAAHSAPGNPLLATTNAIS